MRVMSNVPVMVDEAMSVVAPGKHAETSTSRSPEEVLGYVGRVLRLDERYLDAVTATSGSGPAYFFLLAEAMIEACILLGLSRDVATDLIIQTMLGSAKMLRDTGTHPVELARWSRRRAGRRSRRSATSRGRASAAFLNAIDAAKKRSEELARGGDEDEGVADGPGRPSAVRWAHDREKKKKEREQRQAERAAARKAAEEVAARSAATDERRGGSSVPMPSASSTTAPGHSRRSGSSSCVGNGPSANASPAPARSRATRTRSGRTGSAPRRSGCP